MAEAAILAQKQALTAVAGSSPRLLSSPQPAESQHFGEGWNSVTADKKFPSSGAPTTAESTVGKRLKISFCSDSVKVMSHDLSCYPYGKGLLYFRIPPRQS
jgi:hypothetical protein